LFLMSTQPCAKARGVNASTQTRLTVATIVVRIERRLQSGSSERLAYDHGGTCSIAAFD
jgi:hypothetical protein